MSPNADRLRALHQSPDLLVLVNVWDVASARAVADVPGCHAIATASAAVAAAHGYKDGEHIPIQLVINVLARICDAVDLPVTADLEAGYGDIESTVIAALDAGAVGANIEDGMRPIERAAAGIKVARQVADRAGTPMVLNARTDTHVIDIGLSDKARLLEATKRGLAYLDAGADCVFVPGCTHPDDIHHLVDAFGTRRLSLLAAPETPSPFELERLGVARLSHGPFPHRSAMADLTRYAARALS